MSKNEVMYEYSKKEYENAINRKNEIRNRSATFYSIGVTIMSAATTISFSVEECQFSILKILLLSISVLTLMIYTILFLSIYSPSNQEVHSPKNLLNDLRVIETFEDNKKLVEYYRERGEYKYILRELSLAYIAERLAENFDLYDKKNKKFMKYFSWMSILIIISIVLVIISITV